MATTKKCSTKKPTGLSIARNGSKFTFSWKIADKDHGQGQQVQYRTWDGSYTSEGNAQWTSWTAIDASVGKTATEKKQTISLTAGLKKVQFRVRGRRSNYSEGTGSKQVNYKPEWSDWAKTEMKFSAPKKPTASVALTTYNKTTLTWSVEDKETKPVLRVLLETILYPNCPTTDVSKVPWKSGTYGYHSEIKTSSSGTWSYPTNGESSSVPTGKYTRWYRVTAIGCGGNTRNSARHVFSTPSKAVVSSKKAVVQGSSELVTVEWNSDANSANNPIDNTKIEYYLGVPAAGLTYGSTGTDSGLTITDVNGKQKAQFTIGATVGLDECLFIRVNNTHDNNTTNGDWVLVKRGSLKPPTITSATVSGNSVSITAQNTSDVPGSYMSVFARTASRPKDDQYVGSFTAGTSQQTASFSIPSAWANETSITFGVRAVVVSNNGNMVSTITYLSGTIPSKPATLTLSRVADKPDTINAAWSWTWSDATGAELAWADHDDAWMSTEEPQVYTITVYKAQEWHISGLEEGKTWYVRVRQFKTEGETTTYAAWSDIKSIDLSSAPEKPVLTLSKDVIAAGEELTCSWVYVSSDTTYQGTAEVCVATVSGSTVTYGNVLARTTTAQFATIDTSKLSWTAGNTYFLCVRVKSQSGVTSAWSDPVPITVASALNMSVTLDATAFGNVTITDEDEDSRTVYSLKEMPFDVTVADAADCNISIIVERAKSYHMDRPDGNEFNGYEGEAVIVRNVFGNDTYEISINDKLAPIDDGAAYRIIVIAEDSVGQTDRFEQEFEVHWTHQAIEPTTNNVTVSIADAGYALISTTAPTGTATGDVVDIYRLTADKPEKIVDGGEWGTDYVDPYPTIGENGGHRIVFRTANGDYITEDDHPAWLDLKAAQQDVFETDNAIINFGGNEVQLQYNLDASNKWDKDFRTVKYMGGSIQGYWNAGIGRSGSIDTVMITLLDMEDILLMRQLAEYNGICRVRTPDGSNFTADVQVSESRGHSNKGIIPSFSLSFTRVDPEELDGIPYSQFVPEEETEEEQEETEGE